MLNNIESLLPAITGTLLVSILAITMATPIGIIISIFISEYASKFTKKTLLFFFKVLSSMPSILIGLTGFIIILSLNTIFNLKLRTSLILSAFSLSILILPYIVNTTSISLSNIPNSLRLSTISLGAKKHHSILYVLLPEIRGGILHGTILALARAVEDTAVIMLTGVAAFSGYPTSLLSSFEALPFFIYYKSAEYSNQQELDQVLMAIIILVIINISLIFLADIIFKNKKEQNG